LERELEVPAGDAARMAETSRRAARKARRILGEIETPQDARDESEQDAVSSADESVQYAEEWALDALISVKALEAAAAAQGAAKAAATAEVALDQMAESPLADRAGLDEAAARAEAAAHAAAAESTAAEAAAARAQALADTGTVAEKRKSRRYGGADREPVDAAARWARLAAADATAAKAAAQRAEVLQRGGRTLEARPAASSTGGDVSREREVPGVGSIPSVSELVVAGIIAFVGAVASAVGLAVTADENGTSSWEYVLLVGAGLAVITAGALVFAGYRRLAKMRTVRTRIADFERRVHEIDAGTEGAADPVALADEGRTLWLTMVDAGARQEADSIGEKVAHLAALDREPRTADRPDYATRL
jgi:hypothetical protein